MGFSTEYLGFVTITPPLNRAEAEWLTGFADWGGLPDGDPFRLPMNPRAAIAQAFRDRGGSMSSPGGIPSGVYDWRVCEHGDRIMWRRMEKSNDAEQALSFLVDHYLGHSAKAKNSDNPDFADFTFDHHLDGVVAGQRDDTDELFLLRVRNSEFSHETLVAGVEWWAMPGALDGLLD